MLDTAEMPAAQNEAPPVQRIVLSISEVTIILGLAPSTVYDLHHAGALTIRKIGNKSVILKSDIDKYLKSSIMPRRKVRRRHDRAAAPAAAPGAA